MVTRYALKANGRIIATGALALVVTQAAALAAQGQTAYVADAHGRTVRVAANGCELIEATELFPTYNPNETPAWLNRAQHLIAQTNQ